MQTAAKLLPANGIGVAAATATAAAAAAFAAVFGMRHLAGICPTLELLSLLCCQVVDRVVDRDSIGCWF